MQQNETTRLSDFTLLRSTIQGEQGRPDRGLPRGQRSASLRKWSFASVVAAVSMPLVAQVQITTDVQRAPTLTVERHQEDWSHLANPVWGFYATLCPKKIPAIGIDVYYLGLRDRHAVFDQGSGRQVVHTFGSRVFGDTGVWHWNVEGALQRGTFGDKRVEAWGSGGKVGRRFPRIRLQPELTATLDVISGDGDPDDSRLGTFNPLFPRSSYFAAQSPVGPRNLIHLQPSATIHPHRDIAVSLTGIAYWRQSTGDGIYAIPGMGYGGVNPAVWGLRPCESNRHNRLFKTSTLSHHGRTMAREHQVLWPQCPARISSDGQSILLSDASAVIPVEPAVLANQIAR